jgi:phosphoglycolate phosphatase
MTADAVLFDLDGVLVDSRAAFAGSVNAALADQGRPQRPADELYGYLGPPLHRTFAALVPEAGEDELDALVLGYRARYRSVMASESTLFPGIADTLDRLAGELPLVVATSKAQALAEPLLKALGVARFFGAIVGPSLQARDEAKSLTIARALEGLPHARRAVMVGDRKFDVLGARAHDLPCIGVLWGIGSERELRDAGAAALASAPADLPELLGA